MNQLFLFIFLFLFRKNSLESNNAGSFKLHKEKNIPFFNFSLTPFSSPLELSKKICFGQCLRNEFCSFVVYKNNICSLHTEYALTRLVNNPNLKVVFEKNLIFDHCICSPCINGATCLSKLDDYICLCDLGYFGKNCEKNITSYSCPSDNFRLNETDACKPCMSGFSTFNNYPFNCYKTDNVERNFESAKMFCQSLNSSLWSPKTRTELNIFATNRAWVNSKIAYVGEPFVWPDGSRAYGMANGEPNNRGGDNNLLVESVLIYYNSSFHDYMPTDTIETICQQQ